MSFVKCCFSRVYETCDDIFSIVNGKTVDDEVYIRTFRCFRTIGLFQEIFNMKKIVFGKNTSVTFLNISLQLLFHCTSFWKMYGGHHHKLRPFLIL